MKKFNFANLFLASLITVFSFSIVRAQTEIEPAVPVKQAELKKRPNLLKELSLTQEQRVQIRRINQEKRQFAQDARERLDAANKNLDQAIYADNLNETEVQMRIKEVHAAQAELLKIRSTNELAVRKILTVEQLAKFRNIRDRFEQQTKNNFSRMQKNPNQNNNQRFKFRSRSIRRGN